LLEFKLFDVQIQSESFTPENTHAAVDGQ